MEFGLNFEILGHFSKKCPNLGPFPTNSFWKSRPTIRSRGKATMLKRCVYGSFQYQLFNKKMTFRRTHSKNWKLCLINKTEGIFFRKTTFANRGFWGVFMRVYVLQMRPPYGFLLFSFFFFFFLFFRWGTNQPVLRDDETTSIWIWPDPRPNLRRGQNKCVSIPSLQIFNIY